MECRALPLWDPLPTRCTFIHFEEDIVEKAWLGRAATCPSTLAPAALVFADRTPAAASAARRRRAAFGGDIGRAPLVGAATSAASEEGHRSCDNGHALMWCEATGNFCDRCGRQAIEPPEHIFRCDCCDFDLCGKCYTKARHSAALEKPANIALEKPAPAAASEANPYSAKILPQHDRESTGIHSKPTKPDRQSAGAKVNTIPVEVPATAGAWQVARSKRENRRNLLKSPAAALEAAVNKGRAQPVVTEQPKDINKLAVTKKGRQHLYTELAEEDEEEDAHTDETGSTVPGGEEVTSGASTSGKEQGSWAASAKPPQVGEAASEAGADGEAEDCPELADDGWTQVPARKRERKDLASPIPLDSPSNDQCDPVPNKGEGRGRQLMQRRAGTISAKKAAAELRKTERVEQDDGSKGEVADAEVSGSLSGAISQNEDPPAVEAPAPRGSRTMLSYKVGIKQDDDFNLMRRLLVPGGGHIKRIAQISGAKLTVRGQGAALFEGQPVRQEANDEPISICIWSAYASSLERAKREVVELLRHLHEEYRTFCRRRQLPTPTLRIAQGESSRW